MIRVFVLLACFALGGCAAVLVGGAATTAGAVHDRRSVGTVLDDNTLEVAAIDRIYSEREKFKGTRIKAVAHNGVVLLIGEVFTEEQKRRAAERTMELQGTRRVVNELAIGEPPSNWRRGADSALTARVKAALVGIDLPEFDASRVNVTTVRGEVYLMGLVRRAEADAAVDAIRPLRGVRRIVKVFEYLD